LHLEEKTFYTSCSASPALVAPPAAVSMPAVIAATIGASAVGTAAVSIAFLGSASHIYITK